MSAMIRKQVYILPHHERLLKERAKKYKVTEAELIRRALARELTTRQAPDPTGWEAMKRYIERYRMKPVRQRRRRWTRDDLYDR